MDIGETEDVRFEMLLNSVCDSDDNVDVFALSNGLEEYQDPKFRILRMLLQARLANASTLSS